MAVGLLILATAALRNAVPAISTGRVGPAGHSTTVDLRQLNSFRGGSTATTSGAELEWHDLTFTVKDGAKTILSSCNGRAARGRMLAIMGPSGGGKTTLLNALAGNLKEGKRTALTGQLLCDGEACGGAAEVSGLRMAFVAQEDTFYTQMTVRETLMFAARLRLPDSVSLVEKTRRVDEIISKLSLVKAADTVIGDVKRRGISGGERKRLAIGCELLSDPQLLFLDEPTSGLDSFAALKVVQSLKRLTAEGCTVVMSIHQPRGSIYNLFDDLLLLSEGRVVYNGAAAEAASHFGRRGFKCPPTINAGEFVVDLVSTSYASAEEEEASHARILDLEAAAKHALAAAGIKRATTGKSAAASEAASAAAAGARRGVGRRVAGGSRWTQFRLLFKRAWGEVARSKAAIIIKATQQVMIALIYGGIYSLNDAQSSIQDRFGLLSLIAIGAGNLAIASTIRTFPKEKAIVTNERAKGMYGVLPYFSSKVVAEAPLSAALSALGGVALYPLCGLNPQKGKFGKFLLTLTLEGFASGALGLLLGAVAPSTDVALALFPPILVLMIIFNGFNLAEENTPKVLRWLPKASFIRWCSEGLAVNEFSGLTFTCPKGRPQSSCTSTGEQALERVSFERSTVKRANLMQSRIIGTCYGLTLLTLQRNKPKFLSVTAA